MAKRQKMRTVGLILAGIWLISGAALLVRQSGVREHQLRVLAYSSFMSSWGPGPELIAEFEKQTGIKVEAQSASDAGLLLKQLELFPADVVIGFDQISIIQARQQKAWVRLNMAMPFAEPDFAAFDYGPLAFVYRKGEIEPPHSLDDLLNARFHKQITLQDPRTSSPGLQFLFWVLEEKGIDQGFRFLDRLRLSLHTVAASWSASYGVFQKKRARLALSYLTSPVYHWHNDNDQSYQAAVFSSGHPMQIEYVGVPEDSANRRGAIEFVRYMLGEDAQRVIMKKNYMLPVRSEVAQGTEFARLPDVKLLRPQKTQELMRDREALLQRWAALGL